MKVALDRHEAGTLQVIPIIVEACDWKSSPLSQLKALAKDGKPISMWKNEDVAYLDVVTELRRVLEANGKRRPASVPSRSADNSSAKQEARRYRIKKEFDTIDRANFAQKSFTTIRDYFEASIAELNQVGEPIRARFEKMSETAFTCTVLNKGTRNGVAHITVHLSGGRFLGDITYSFSLRAPDNTANGHVSVLADNYEQYLSLNSFRFGAGEEKRLTAEAVAEAIWREFTSQAGIDHD
jgi:hypothetical protein